MERFFNNNNYKKLPDYVVLQNNQLRKDFTKIKMEQYDGGVFENTSNKMMDNYAKNCGHVGIVKVKNVEILQQQIKNNNAEFNCPSQQINNLNGNV